MFIDDLQRIAFKDVKLVPGDEISPFYLDITYEFETVYMIGELHIPKVGMDAFFKRDLLPDIIKSTKFDYEFASPLESLLYYEFDNRELFIAPNYDYKEGLRLGSGSKLKENKETEYEIIILKKKLGHK